MNMKSLLFGIILALTACHCQPPQPAPYTSDTFHSQIDEKRYKAVVRVITPCGWGSGVAIGPRTIITAGHVVLDSYHPRRKCQRSKHIQILTWGTLVHAEVVGVGKNEKDVVKLEIKGGSMPYWFPVRQNRPLVGERICYMGGNRVLKRLVTKCGEVNNYDTDEDVWFNIHVVAGNSGGPLFDEDWNVVGIVVWRDRTAFERPTPPPWEWEDGGGGVIAKYFP